MYLVCSRGFMKPDNIILPDGRVMEFHPKDEVLRDYWNSLTAAIKTAFADEATL